MKNQQLWILKCNFFVVCLSGVTWSTLNAQLLDDPQTGSYVYPAYYSTNEHNIGAEIDNYSLPYHLTLPQANHDKMYSDMISQFKWDQNTIYYDVNPDISHDIQVLIQAALDLFNQQQSCIQFRQRLPMGNDFIENYMSFISPDDKEDPTCEAHVGMQGGRQAITIGHHCLAEVNDWKMKVNVVLHEMMHAAGLRHEHQRPDRDCFMFISNNLTCNPWTTEPFGAYDYLDPRYFPSGFPYDYYSVTNYPKFSEFHLKQYHPHESPNKNFFGTNGTLSKMDVMKLHFIYCGGKSYCQIPENHQECINLAANVKFDTLCRHRGGEFDTEPYTC